jgi:hypothetical protein
LDFRDLEPGVEGELDGFPGDDPVPAVGTLEVEALTAIGFPDTGFQDPGLVSGEGPSPGSGYPGRGSGFGVEGVVRVVCGVETSHIARNLARKWGLVKAFFSYLIRPLKETILVLLLDLLALRPYIGIHIVI